MIKVMIIDDEPIIVEGLTRSINWEEKGCEVVASADNGIEGIEKIAKYRPDIIFSDIRMPNMDGLTMIASIKSMYPETEVSILTGFQDFEYARKAITLGVTRFLVKPSKMEELNEAVNVMVSNVRAKRNAEQNESLEEDDGLKVESEASSFLVNNAIRYMEEHYTEKLKLQDVADSVYVSQWHLSKLLNKYKEQSFSDLLNSIRIDKAKELLKNPALRIGDVAEMVGFLDMAHFSRVFKRQTGLSANEYRNKIK